MLKDERQERIAAFVNENKYASVAELSGFFQVSRATIRRDLDEMEAESRLKLTHGGAVSNDKSTSFELSYIEKRETNREEKTRIAAHAAAKIKPGETILIDSGTTCVEIPRFLAGMENVIVATNDLMCGIELKKCPGITTIIIGGTMRPHFYNTSGFYAEDFLREFHFDKAFVSMDAIDVEMGSMITNIDEVSVKALIAEVADEVFFLCDHSKFKAKAFVRVCPLEKADMIITSKELPRETASRYREKGANLILV